MCIELCAKIDKSFAKKSFEAVLDDLPQIDARLRVLFCINFAFIH